MARWRESDEGRGVTNRCMSTTAGRPKRRSEYTSTVGGVSLVLLSSASAISNVQQPY